MTSTPNITEWTAPILKQGAVSEATAFGPFPAPIDGALLS